MSAKGQSSTAAAPAPAPAPLPVLPPALAPNPTSYGFLFRSYGLQLLNYVPLNDGNFAGSPIYSWPIEAVVPEADYHPAHLNFSYLITDNKYIHAAHRGLILVSLRPTYTFQVQNPFNRQQVELPASPSLPENHQDWETRYSLEDVAIINFSSDTERNFKVIRIYRQNGRRAEVYWSQTEQWVTHNLGIPNAIGNVKWDVAGAVVLDNTLFILTNKNCVVRVTFNPDNDGLTVHNPLDVVPPPVAKNFNDSALHVSQGFLYVSCCMQRYLGIWRLDGNPLEGQHWIEQFIFEDNKGSPPHLPRAQEYFKQYTYQHNQFPPRPLNMHPERPIVYLRGQASIVAFHLLDDLEANGIVVRNDLTIFPRDFYVFSPCSSVLLEH